MRNSLIEKSIKINVSLNKVWRVFTEPAVTRKMGGEYVTDWKEGSSFGWKGLDGNMYTNGTILRIENEQLIAHNLFSSAGEKTVSSVITYTFKESDGFMILDAREDLSAELTDTEYQQASEGWDIALDAVKRTAENL
ncbi:MAG TPA: SRPBCC domain-containing protein [Chitinophagaceae bacterium]|nr:SRPBCC domain-containing protein [Chitinophagaceae bacterium]